METSGGTGTKSCVGIQPQNMGTENNPLLQGKKNEAFCTTFTYFPITLVVPLLIKSLKNIPESLKK